jgi:hypothetical protein
MCHEVTEKDRVVVDSCLISLLNPRHWNIGQIRAAKWPIMTTRDAQAAATQNAQWEWWQLASDGNETVVGYI